MTAFSAENSQAPSPESPGARYDRMRIGYAAVDPNGLITDANAMFRKQAGLPDAAPPGQPFSLADTFSRHDVKLQFQEHLASVTVQNPVSVNCIDLGEGRLFQVHTVGTFSTEGELAGYEMATIDLGDTFATLSQALQAMTVQRNEARQTAQALSHDTRNPVNRAGKFTQMAMRIIDRVTERNAELSDEVREMIGEARGLLVRVGANAEKATAIMSAYLELESINHASFEPRPVRMKEILSSLEEETREAVERSHARLVVPDTMPDPLGKRQWVEQVWVNLVGNAAKYAGESPVIELGHEILPDNRVRYWVRDNGPGIPEEHIPKLFRTFSRLDPSIKDGTGLGLALVKTLVEKMGGQVGVESREGEGATFFFILPAA